MRVLFKEPVREVSTSAKGLEPWLSPLRHELLEFPDGRPFAVVRDFSSTHHARTQKSVAASTLSSNPWHDIAARGIAHSELTVSFLLKTRRIAGSQTHVRRWTHSCLPS